MWNRIAEQNMRDAHLLAEESRLARAAGHGSAGIIARLARAVGVELKALEYYLQNRTARKRVMRSKQRTELRSESQ